MSLVVAVILSLMGFRQFIYWKLKWEWVQVGDLMNLVCCAALQHYHMKEGPTALLTLILMFLFCTFKYWCLASNRLLWWTGNDVFYVSGLFGLIVRVSSDRIESHDVYIMLTTCSTRWKSTMYNMNKTKNKLFLPSHPLIGWDSASLQVNIPCLLPSLLEQTGCV